MFKYLIVFLALLPFVIILLVDDYSYVNTRKTDSMKRRISIVNHTTLSKKNIYIKNAINNVHNTNNNLNIGTIALEMNMLETRYKLPYTWGGDIKDFTSGLDCTGFIHGMMYYLGENSYIKRFNTYSLYKKLLHDKDYKLVYKSSISSIKGFGLKQLQVGDIVMWPSGVNDAKNLPVISTFGHIGVVSKIENNVPYVTHFVRSEAYNNLDTIGIRGSGINTLTAKEFITLKQRGVLYIFRRKYV
jgi:hypothetical protein